MQWIQTAIWEILTWYKEKKTHCDSRQTLEQVAWRGYKISSLKIFKSQLDTALSNLIELDLLWAGRLHEIKRGSFHLTCFHGFMIDLSLPAALMGSRDLCDNVRLGGFIFNASLSLTEISMIHSLHDSVAKPSSSGASRINKRSP